MTETIASKPRLRGWLHLGMAPIAFIVAFGVLIDTFLVRTLLVPALSYDIGPAIWWPAKPKADQAAHAKAD